MIIIGIDPGVSGSICFLKDGKILDVIGMPVMNEGKKNKKQVNGAQIYNEISKKINSNPEGKTRVVIEHVTAMPGQGVTSMFNFGQSFGVLKGICSAMRLPMFFVRPANGKDIIILSILKKMLVELGLLRYFHISHHSYQKKKIQIRLMLY